MHDLGSAIDENTFRIQRLLSGPIQRLWDHLTEPELRGRWLAGGSLEPREGGAFTLVFHDDDLSDDDDPTPEQHQGKDGHTLNCRLTIWDPPSELAYTWPEEPGGESLVHFALEEREDGVLLTLTHSRVPSKDQILQLGPGWHAHLDILAARLKGQEPPGFWRSYGRLQSRYQPHLS